MAKVSSAIGDAMHLAQGFKDGWGVITAARSLVYQFPPMKEAKGDLPAGYQGPPALFVELEIQRYADGDGNKTSDPPETKLLSVQKPSKDTGLLDLVHPGKYTDENFDDAVDCGGDLGAEGDTLFALKDGYQLLDSCGWWRFALSAQEDGFKPEIMKRTFFPDLVGLYAYFTTVTLPKFRDNMTNDPTAFVVKKGTTKRFPYEQVKGTATAAAPAKSAGKPAGAKGKPAAAAPAAAAPAAAPAPATNGATTITADEIATALLIDTLAPAKRGVTLSDSKKLRVEALMCMSKHKPAIPQELKKAVQDTLTEDWLTATGLANGLFDIADDGRIVFAS